jgi:hypothetical protein
MRYTVRIEDNAHYGDESERRTIGEYEDAEVAMAAARRIVDEDLDSLYLTGMTPDQLHSHYTMLDFLFNYGHQSSLRVCSP